MNTSWYGPIKDVIFKRFKSPRTRMYLCGETKLQQILFNHRTLRPDMGAIGESSGHKIQKGLSP